MFLAKLISIKFFKNPMNLFFIIKYNSNFPPLNSITENFKYYFSKTFIYICNSINKYSHFSSPKKMHKRSPSALIPSISCPE